MSVNLFRCSCGARLPCGTGDVEYDKGHRELRRDHKRMGHTVLRSIKIPSNPIEDKRMVVNDDEDATSWSDDNAYSYKDGERVGE